MLTIESQTHNTHNRLASARQQRLPDVLGHQRQGNVQEERNFSTRQLQRRNAHYQRLGLPRRGCKRWVQTRLTPPLKTNHLLELPLPSIASSTRCCVIYTMRARTWTPRPPATSSEFDHTIHYTVDAARDAAPFFHIHTIVRYTHPRTPSHHSSKRENYRLSLYFYGRSSFLFVLFFFGGGVDIKSSKMLVGTTRIR